MATNSAPPAYAESAASVPAYPQLDGGEGGADAAPPSYNPSAPSVPSGPSAPVAITAGTPGSAAPTIQYINPTPQQQPQQVQVQQVQQQQQPQVIYQQQQPVQQQVTYVNQFGQPIAAPTAQPVQIQPTVTYVNQFGQPVAPAVQPQAVQPSTAKPLSQWRNPSQSQRNQRNIAMTAGILAALILFIAMCIGEMASGEYSSINVTCTFYELEISDSSGYYYDNAYTYSSECYFYDSDWWDTSTGYSGIGSHDDWCNTYQAANWFIAMTVFSFIFVLPGLLIVQTCCFIERCCGGHALPKVFYIISCVLGIGAVIVWYSGDTICTDTLELDPAASPIMVIVATVLILIGAITAQ
eukprot:221797_1